MAEEITENCVKLKGGSTIDTENVIWTAGNRPNLGIEAPGLPVDERTGIKVDEFLRVEGHENVWAIGDCAAVQDVRAEQDGKIVPPTAQAAVQQGHVVARNILAAIDGEARRHEEVRVPAHRAARRARERLRRQRGDGRAVHGTPLRSSGAWPTWCA